MTGRLAILACGGALPVALAAVHPDAMQITLRGIPSDLAPTAREFQLEKIGSVFSAMKAEGVDRMVFAGHLARPPLNPADFDADMMRIAPGLMMALPQGDDALLRFVIRVFEDQGFQVIGAHELLPGLTAEQGLSVGSTPTKTDLSDGARGADILSAISPLDIGQGCVVAGGMCLGIETVQGTDALLGFVAQTPDTLRRGAKGVYVKAAKRGQDLRIDMPTIGPSTIAAVANAGLAGLVIEADKTVILNRAETTQAVEDAGIFLTSQVL